MRSLGQSISRGALWLSCCFLLSSYGCATRSSGYTTTAKFADAARAAGVHVRPGDIVSITDGSATFVTAAVQEWEQTPATALRKGADIAFAYSAGTGLGVPDGYYRVRAFADVSAIGTVAGTVQLVNQSGTEVAKLPATFEVHSLTIPEKMSSNRTFTTITNEKPQEARRRIVIWCCSNGVCIIISTIII
jgi:hypothetical protein